MPRERPWISSPVRILSGLMAKRGAGPGTFRGVGGLNGGGGRISPRMKVLASLLALAVAALLSIAGVGGGSGLGGSGIRPNAVARTEIASTALPSSVADQLTDAPASQVQAARAGELRFRGADRLSSHFGKHRAEAGCSTESEYVAAANAVVANDAALHKEEADGDDIYYLEETGELVVVSTKGYIRTYFISDLDYFGRQ